MHRFAGVLLCFAAAFAVAPDRQALSDDKSDGKADKSQLYEVVDGTKVDTKTLNGWKTWRALACERCHGAQQEGLVGPPLVESMKNLTKDEFHEVMMNGRPEKGMPPFN